MENSTGTSIEPETTDGDSELANFVEAVTAIAEAVGGSVVAAQDMADRDVPVLWKETTVVGVRLPDPHLDLHDALPTLIDEVANELGLPCSKMNRSQKQEVVLRLNERGAFTLRKSVEDVAKALGVSRFTVYNYLERAEAD